MLAVFVDEMAVRPASRIADVIAVERPSGFLGGRLLKGRSCGVGL